MKRFFAIFICIATALIFVACTNNSETKSSKTETTQISAQNSGDEKKFCEHRGLYKRRRNPKGHRQYEKII